MSRPVEAVLVAAACVVAALGVATVRFASGSWLDAQVFATLAAFGVAFGGLHLAVLRWAPGADQLLLPLTGFLAAIGFAEVFRIDPELANIQRWSLLVAAAAGAVVLRLLRREGLGALRRYRYLFLAGAVLLLLLPLLPESWPIHGATVNGSRLWVRARIPGLSRALSFQPGELAKVFLVVFLASYLADRAPAMAVTDRRLGPLRLPEPRHLAPVVVAAGAAFLVLVYQRDLGASLVIFALFVTMLYAATGRAIYLGLGAGLTVVGGVVGYVAFAHVRRRVAGWLWPFADYFDTGYQVAQGLFALGSGSLTGAGLGLGRPDLIPAATTDYIYAAIGEELGLAGTVAVLTAFALWVAVGFGIALRSKDRFRKFFATGLTTLVGLQSAVIVAGVLRLFPVTGVTLPFLSYGGSSLLASMIAVVLLARVSHEERP
ncbi:MAG TPA: FtsW/RodA/SpoVE family cell cycle protein [Actinobacteria bacterium]|nr:FtsW/RodA/SpoVE family cell cycle protein [Actinomycetota bacterium]